MLHKEGDMLTVHLELRHAVMPYCVLVTSAYRPAPVELSFNLCHFPCSMSCSKALKWRFILMLNWLII